MFQSNFEGNSLSRQILFSTVTFLFLISGTATCHAQTLAPQTYELEIEVNNTTWTGNESNDWFPDVSFVNPDPASFNWLGLPEVPITLNGNGDEVADDVRRDRLAVGGTSLSDFTFLVDSFFLPNQLPYTRADGVSFAVFNWEYSRENREFRGPHSTFSLNSSRENSTMDRTEFANSYTFQTPRVFIPQRGDLVNLPDNETSITFLSVGSSGNPLDPPATLGIIQDSRLNVADIRADRFGRISNSGRIIVNEGSIAVDGEFENRSRLTVDNGAILVGGDLDQTFGGSTSIEGGNLIVVGSVRGGEVNFEGGNVTIGALINSFGNNELRIPFRPFAETVVPVNPTEPISYAPERLSLSNFDTGAITGSGLDLSNEAAGADFESINSSRITLGPNPQINGDFTNTGDIIVTGENSFVPISGTVINRGNISVEDGATLIVLDLDNESTVSTTGGEISLEGAISNHMGEILATSGGEIVVTGTIENQIGEINSETGDIFIRGGQISNEFGEISSDRGDIEISGGRTIGGLIQGSLAHEIIIFGGRFENVSFDGNVQVLGGASLDGVEFFGRLGGAGFLEGNFVNHGVIAPGFSPGTLNFAGDVTLAETSILEMEVFGSQPGQFDVLNVSGNLELGGSVEIDFGDFVPQADDEIEFLVVDNMTGEFDNVTIGGSGVSNDGGVSFDVVQSGGSLMLTNFAPILLGDVNLDGVVDFSDIPAFIEVLSTGEFQAEADTDQSGFINFLDIPAFIRLLSGQ